MIYVPTLHEFHNKVQKVLNTLQEQLLVNQPQFKLRDHQHLTYDLFAKEKGNKESYGYKLRSLFPRYQSRQCNIPNDLRRDDLCNFYYTGFARYQNAISNTNEHKLILC